jgi:hypothetical protein
MPIKSQAQRRKFAELLVAGKISSDVYERWNRGAGSKELPEHVKPKAKPKGKRKTTAKSKNRTPTSTSKRTAQKRSTTTRKTTKRASRAR